MKRFGSVPGLCSGVCVDISQLWELYLTERVFKLVFPKPWKIYYQVEIPIRRKA